MIGETFKIRVITPVLARAHSNRNNIPIIRGSVTSETTLRQLKGLIVNHLGLDVGNSVQCHEECNCSFARHINGNASVQDTSGGDGNKSTLKLMVVGGANNVAVLDVEFLEEVIRSSSIIARLREEFGDMIDSKEINLIGGTPSPDAL